MANFQESFLSGSNIEFIEGLYARYLEDPNSVDPSWREIFERNLGQGHPIYALTDGNGANGKATQAAVAPPRHVQAPPAPQPLLIHDQATAQSMNLQAKVDQTIYAFRLRGHLLAKLDPLGRPRPPLEHAADLSMVNENHFSQAELEQLVDPNEVFQQKRVRLADLMTRLRRTYCDSIGVEYMTLLDSDRRRWLMPRMEHHENHVEPAVPEQLRILEKLTYAEQFEGFLHTKYLGAKRFSVDGGEALLPMMDVLLDEGGKMGMQELVIGMAHRGRLNVLTNILGKSPDQIFNEFEGPTNPRAFINRGDVKYHQGFSSDYVTASGKKIHLSLAFNPSHLEAVDPVVLGRVRAKQDRLGDTERKGIVPLLIHGDAAFAGQGVVAETFNLAELRGYDVGGTIHIVINNQVGFTTDPHDSRSTIYCTGLAHMLDIPIFHVNGDDPEACVHVMKLATQYRQTFKSDVVIDLVCYRRYGHNEADEPAYTQPQMYELIKAHSGVRQLYAEDLARRGRVPAEQAEAIKHKVLDDLQQAHARVKQQRDFREPSAFEGQWNNYKGGSDKDTPQVETAVPREKLAELLNRLTEVPESFTPHSTINRLLQQRKAMAQGATPLDWSAGESLAYATLLSEGWGVRLTGQDVERGTFSHRHAVLHDVKNGAKHSPLAQVQQKPGLWHIYNSPLSEMGCLGFEFGYSLDRPETLVIWEAQFGDFANNAQVIIDQFIVASERKWRRLTGLVMLLPHGYEGMGPEHSSARLERFLELAGDDNIQVCYPTTPAQIFHLLRRQLVRPLRKPLIVMSPKSLLRKPEASSTLEELASGGFKRIIEDARAEPSEVTRLLLCSGKVYYDLAQERDARKDKSVAIVRLEQLYPFPEEELTALMAKLPRLSEVFWVQEEPKNMGAWRYIFPLLNNLASSRPQPTSLTYVGRAEAASPATGFDKAHKLEQQTIVEEAMAKGGTNGR
ncbi:MAG TPA: 2-oxoglutarate dehydrogenase E1 component [Myxococcaceae bacterium]|nr:2-oxoglutarate dehydrogenase E1 component [Myxococcaceae bacterium]